MTRQLTLPKENQNDLTVWSCLFLNDNTVIVGDSLGRVIFYDGKLGALLNTFKVIGIGFLIDKVKIFLAS